MGRGARARPMNRPARGALHFRPMPVLTGAAAVVLATVLVLGHWQWSRFAAKRAGQADAVSAMSVPVEQALAGRPGDRQRVTAQGVWAGGDLQVRATRDGRMGARLFAPLRLDSGGIIWVDRGFAEIAPDARTGPKGAVRIVGVLREAKPPNAFIPDNAPARNLFYWPDIAAMQALWSGPGAKAPAAATAATAQTRFYVAEGRTDPLGTGRLEENPWAHPLGVDRIEPERHLGYALTWWGFGLALIGVYTGLHVRAGRLGFRSPGR